MPSNSSNVNLGSINESKNKVSGYVIVNRHSKRAIKHTCQSNQSCIHKSVYGDSNAVHKDLNHHNGHIAHLTDNGQSGCAIM